MLSPRDRPVLHTKLRVLPSIGIIQLLSAALTSSRKHPSLRKHPTIIRLSRVNSIQDARVRRLAWLLTFILALVVAALTLGPATAPPLPGGDKLHHLLGFAALALPAALFSPRDLWIIAPLLVLFGGAIELVQPYFGRSRELLDAAMNAFGVATGGAVGLFIQRRLRR